jgi:hypothetical protein
MEWVTRKAPKGFLPWIGSIERCSVTTSVQIGGALVSTGASPSQMQAERRSPSRKSRLQTNKRQEQRRSVLASCSSSGHLAAAARRSGLTQPAAPKPVESVPCRLLDAGSIPAASTNFTLAGETGAGPRALAGISGARSSVQGLGWRRSGGRLESHRHNRSLPFAPPAQVTPRSPLPERSRATDLPWTRAERRPQVKRGVALGRGRRPSTGVTSRRGENPVVRDQRSAEWVTRKAPTGSRFLLRIGSIERCSLTGDVDAAGMDRLTRESDAIRGRGGLGSQQQVLSPVDRRRSSGTEG